MKSILFLLSSFLPLAALAQSGAPAGVGLGNYQLKMRRTLPASNPVNVAQNLAPGSYESSPNTLRIIFPDSVMSFMPNARTTSSEPAGGIAPLPPQQYEKKRRP